MSQTTHYSVLLDESINALVQKRDGFYIDGTFGRGGHSERILSALTETGSLLAFDKDLDAVRSAQTLLSRYANFGIEHTSFADIGNVLESRHQRADGILLDLGVSSPQLDQADRGFSFMRDGPLDMRMDRTSGMSAATWVAETDEAEMARVFKVYGEERFSKRVARKIVDVRQQAVINSTLQLAEIVRSAIPVKKEEGKHPATRVFQAIRIEINRELKDLELALASFLRVLNPGGRIVIISFHSLEDRIVKRFFRKFSQSQDFPMGVPVTYDKLKAPLTLCGRAVKAPESEIEQNVRSRSAVMRVAERTDL